MHAWVVPASLQCTGADVYVQVMSTWLHDICTRVRHRSYLRVCVCVLMYERVYTCAPVCVRKCKRERERERERERWTQTDKSRPVHLSGSVVMPFAYRGTNHLQFKLRQSDTETITNRDVELLPSGFSH